MKRFINGKAVRHAMRKKQPREIYIAKSYVKLHRQINALLLGTLSESLADDLLVTMQRPGFMRSFIQPENAAELNKAADELRENLRIKREAQSQARKEVYEKYYKPYHRNVHSYPTIPEEVMESVGLTKSRPTGNLLVDACFQEGYL